MFGLEEADRLAELENCPMCKSLILSTDGKYHCQNCGMAFSKTQGNAILVNHIDSMPIEELGPALSMLYESAKILVSARLKLGVEKE